jgi:hypothetical protein
LQKGWILCQEVTVQVLAAKGQAQDVVWDEARARVEAEWADLILQGRVVIAFARTVEQLLLMLPGSLVMQKAALNVEQK